MKHDIIYIKRTHRWVCKCGEAGYTESTKNQHEKAILDEANTPLSNEQLTSLTEKVLA